MHDAPPLYTTITLDVLHLKMRLQLKTTIMSSLKRKEKPPRDATTARASIIYTKRRCVCKQHS